MQGIFGALDTPWLKPQREFTDHVLKTLGGEPATTLLIGDSPWDVEAARRGGFPGWTVTTGTHNAAELKAAGAEKIFDGLPAIQVELEKSD